MKTGGLYRYANERVSIVPCDDITAEVARVFDYPFSGRTAFTLPAFTPPEDFAIGLIVGPSGSGKSSLLLDNFLLSAKPEWDDRAVCSHFASATEAKERLAATGLNSVPAWLRPFHVLSTGEQFRAELARLIDDDAVIDEFTSVVDRQVAKSTAFAVQRYIRSRGLRRVVFATCHYDIAEWLSPDWTFDTASGQMSAGRLERRPEIILEVIPSSSDLWPLFRDHHYLSGDINRSARCWLVTWEGRLVGFTAVLAFPRKGLTNGWREHRTVVLPEFQGLGIGVRVSDAIGEIVLSWGGRYFSKTAGERMGAYREASPLWRATSKNKKARPDYSHGRVTKESGYKHRHTARVCYSHEYVGAGA